jgi:pentapeptide MXKDX repeat protein
MKKIIIAAMSLSLLTGTVAFAQNTMGTDTATKKTTKKHKSKKSSTSTDTMSAPK